MPPAGAAGSRLGYGQDSGVRTLSLMFGREGVADPSCHRPCPCHHRSVRSHRSRPDGGPLADPADRSPATAAAASEARCARVSVCMPADGRARATHIRAHHDCLRWLVLLLVHLRGHLGLLLWHVQRNLHVKLLARLYAYRQLRLSRSKATLSATDHRLRMGSAHRRARRSGIVRPTGL